MESETSRTERSYNDARWYSIHDAAAVLGVTVSSLRRRVREGRVQTTTLDGVQVITRARLSAMKGTDAVKVRRYAQRPRRNQ